MTSGLAHAGLLVLLALWSVALPQALHRGDLVTLTGDGFAGGASITISFHSTPDSRSSST